VPIELNAVERERFGIVTARVKDLKASPQAVNSAAEAVGVQMLTIRLDCTALHKSVPTSVPVVSSVILRWTNSYDQWRSQGYPFETRAACAGR